MPNFGWTDLHLELLEVGSGRDEGGTELFLAVAVQIALATRAPVQLAKLDVTKSLLEISEVKALRARQERLGKKLGPYDAQIAAHAIALGAALVSHDSAFRRISNL